MIAIYKCELKAYFTTIIGYIYIAVTMFLVGVYYFAYNLHQGLPYFSYTVQGCTLIILITVPFLTMRLFTVEKKTKADRLILTAPVSEASIVLGKFLAAVTVFIIPCLVSCIYPLVLNRYGTVPVGEAYVAMLGFILYGMACIAIGMFFSSIAVNQIVAAVLSFVVLLIGYMMASIIALVTGGAGFVRTVFGLYDFSTPLNYMMNGVIDIISIIYYLSLMILFIFLTVQSVKKHRTVISGQNKKSGIVSIAGIIVAIAVFAGINIFVKNIPEQYTDIDCSYNRIYSITNETKSFIKSIDKDVTVYVLYTKDGYDEYAVKMLNCYETESDKIHVEYIDYYNNPRFYVKYTDVRPAYGSLIVVSGDNSVVVDVDTLYEYDYTNYYYNESVEISGFKGEGQLNSAIDYVCGGNKPIVYFVTGHGEAELSSNYIESITKYNIDFVPVDLNDTDRIAGNVSAVIINGARDDLSADDVSKLVNYLDRGGRMLITLALTDNNQDNLHDLLDYMDITVEQGLIIENNPNYYCEKVTNLRPNIATMEYTINLTDFPVISNAMSILINESGQVSYETIMVTTSDSYLEKKYEEGLVFNENEGDYESAFLVGVKARCQVTDDDGIITNPEMVVFSSSEMFTDAMDEYSSSANLLIFRSIMDTYAGKGNNISIPSKMLSLPYLKLSNGSKNVIVAITMFIIPVVVLACGIYTCIMRKRYKFG